MASFRSRSDKFSAVSKADVAQLAAAHRFSFLPAFSEQAKGESPLGLAQQSSMIDGMV